MISLSVSKQDILYNEAIKEQEIIVLDDKGEFLGNMLTSEALKLARSKDVDLICQSSKNNILVCKIMDLNKFLYEKKKQQTHKHTSTMKDMQLKFGIHQHDLDIKLNQCKKFLEAKHQVNMSIRIRNRDAKVAGNIEKTNEMIEKFIEKLQDSGTITKKQLIHKEQLLGNLIIAPKK